VRAVSTVLKEDVEIRHYLVVHSSCVVVFDRGREKTDDDSPAGLRMEKSGCNV